MRASEASLRRRSGSARLRTQSLSVLPRMHAHSRRLSVACRAERKEYYDYRDMPPLPITVKRIFLPELDYTVVDKSTESTRTASLAIFMDIYTDDQYGKRLSRKSAITALCMYDRDDINEAQRSPGDFPVIDLLQRVYSEGLDLEIQVEQLAG